MHSYDKNGNPVYQVPYKDASRGLRDTTLRDVKKLGLYPSVTEIIKILDKPGLNNWIQDRVLESALTLPRDKDESDDSYVKRIKTDSQEISRIARDKGVAIHKAIEKAFRGEAVLAEYKDLAFSVMAGIMKELKSLSFAEKTFANTDLGYGGTIDLGADNLIADIKTKEILDTTKKLAWDEHIMQLTAYAKGIGATTFPVLVNIFVGWNGDIEFVYWDDRVEIERGWQMFQACFELWKIQKRYNPT